ncbi:MAG: AMP-binding protein [Candidatus Omnitrophica bacterium]|nr:AMP-binding protein [Candidatus Omnitrophota bacterium]
MKKQVNLEDITILDLLYVLTKKYNKNTALQIKDKEGIKAITYDELRESSVGISSFLIENKVQPKTHIAILTENRPEWAVAFFGIISAACVTVPVDAKLSIKEILFILNDSKSECLFLSGKFLEKILPYRSQLPNLKHIISFDRHSHQGVFCPEDLKYKEEKARNRPQDVKTDDSALIVYTSGTTGVAKGVELTYRNILFEASVLYDLIRFSPEDSFVSILPLNHMLEITGGLIAPLYGGSTVTYCPSLKPAQIISLMREVKATGMVCVPLVLKMFYNGIVKEIEKKGPIKRNIFKLLFSFSKFLLNLRIRAGSVLFKKIHSKFGKNFKYFVCGGAPLDIELEKDFGALGFRILQGYGLTETAPVACVNTLKDHRYGSVGKPVTGVEIKLLQNSQDKQEGEILIKGPNLMKGYYNNPEKTREAIKDGWYYTGDLGYFDKDGFLYICGRSKNLIVLGAGKKVFPEEVEQVMSASHLIREICVIGKKATSGLKEGTEEVFAVVVPDEDRFPQADRKDEAAIRDKISKELSRLSNDLAEYKKISDFIIYRQELPKTSTRKIKRKDVVKLIEESSLRGEIDFKGEISDKTDFLEDEIFQALRDIVARESGINRDNIKASSYLSSDLGIDSLQKVELLTAIEDRLGISISEEMAYEISTFQDLVRFAREYKQGRKDIEVDWEREATMLLRKKILFFPSRLLTLVLLKLFIKVYFRLQVQGAENIPKDKSFIMAANHCSHLDFPVLFSSLPLIKSVMVIAPAAADYFFQRKFLRSLVEISLNIFPFQRFGNFVQSLKLCKELLKKNIPLILFPEGTRSESGQIKEFRPGVGALSCELKVPIVPVYIKGTNRALPKGKFFIKPYKVQIVFGRPLYPGEAGGYKAYEEVTARLKQEIVNLKQEDD